MGKSQGNKLYSAAVNHGLNAAAGTHVEAPQTSNRCRATHDVPYTLRCVLDVSHAVPVSIPERPGLSMVRQHEDKDGRRW